MQRNLIEILDVAKLKGKRCAFCQTNKKHLNKQIIKKCRDGTVKMWVWSCKECRHKNKIGGVEYGKRWI